MHADKCILDIIPNVSSPVVTEVVSGYALYIERRVEGRLADAADNNSSAVTSHASAQSEQLKTGSVDESDLAGVEIIVESVAETCPTR